LALSASTILEVRSTGSDTNSFGFVTGASGTDWSQQDAAQYSVTDGVTAGTTTITSASANFGTDVVGNLIYVQGGTAPITAGWYQITVRTNSTTITVDRSTGLTAGTGATLKIGGAAATIAPALALMTVSGMQMYVKATATYSIATALTFPAGMNYGISPNRMSGYTTTRGDNGRAVIKTTAAVAGIVVGTVAGCLIENFELDGNSTGTTGLSYGGAQIGTVSNVWAHHWTAEGIINTFGNLTFSFCEVSNCAGTTSSFVIGTGIASVVGCYSHDNTKTGFSSLSAPFICCVSANNTGATSDGFLSTSGAMIYGCVAYNNGRAGINYNIGSVGMCIGNILVSNTTYGINTNYSATVTPIMQNMNFNAFYNNTSGARNRLGVGVNDVTLTGVPFTNAAGGDYSLNNTAGQGAACRSVGFPGTAPFGTGYEDIGPLRHQDPSSGIYPIFD
tara:strand:- start:214 stop:1557 length:1344 start_codon:yes stop_codon:yes gene_type:complete